MLGRLLLDTNAILNAAFVPWSWSSLVVSKLDRKRHSLFVGSQSLDEARRKARDYARQLGKRSDPAPIIEYCVRRIGALEVSPSGDAVEAGIPKHDRHVAREAATARATILTSDAKLWAGCNKVGRAAVLPLQALQHLDGLSLGTTVFGVAPGRNMGSVFARVYPGAWASQRDVGQFTVADFSGRLCLSYCNQSRAWLATVPEVAALRVTADVAANEMKVIAVSWEARNGIQLRVSGVPHPASAPMPSPLLSPLVDGASIGHGANRENHWRGSIKSCVMNDRPIGVELWKELRSSEELTPNPYDLDRLRGAMAQVLM